MSKHRAHKASEEFKVGEYLYVYGKPLKIIKIKKLIRHPIQLLQIWVGDDIPLIVSMGWQLDYAKAEDIDK